MDSVYQSQASCDSVFTSDVSDGPDSAVSNSLDSGLASGEQRTNDESSVPDWLKAVSICCRCYISAWVEYLHLQHCISAFDSNIYAFFHLNRNWMMQNLSQPTKMPLYLKFRPQSLTKMLQIVATKQQSERCLLSSQKSLSV